jgi:trigger factor
VREFNDQDIDARLRVILTRYGRLVPFEGKAKAGDYVTVEITTMHEGREVCAAREQVLRIAPVLSFRDGRIEKFDKFMGGVKPGDVKEMEMELASDAPNEELQGKKVQLRFDVLDVKRLEQPELTAQFLQEMGNFESVEALRQAIHDDLERQLAYHQNQQIRRQITAALTASADWELPPGLLRRQSARELERMVLELKRSGFSDMEIRARENELRQNSAAQTATALKEHFILEKIAEQESLDVAPPEYDEEIHLVALQSGEPTRRVRAQLEKRGLMDVLRNQILERKVIDLLRSHAKFKDRPFKPDKADVEAIDLAAGGGDRDSGIPEVKQKVAQAEQDE